MKLNFHHIFIGIVRPLFVIFVAAVMVLALVAVSTYLYFAKDLESKESVMNYKDTGFILFDRNNQPFFTFYQGKYKVFIPLYKIPLHTQQAVIAVEDKDFYNHPGFSIRGIIRSIIANIKSNSLSSGGSTLTQQLVKNSLLTPQKSFVRKYQEVVLAYEIERRYNKAEVLEMYLNSVYFGSGAFGIEEAAHVYFEKEAKDLNIAESAVLASLLPAPSKLSPFNNSFEEIKKRQKIVLESMYEDKNINQEQLKQAEEEILQFSENRDAINSFAPHFALMVKDELIRRFGEEKIIRSGFKVKTTLESEWQLYAEQVVKDQVSKLAVNNAHNGAAVVIDPKNGEIRALVGSKDWFDEKFGKVNVTERLRQPGSSFKPIYYSAALEEGIITPATILNDQPVSYGLNYRPVNYDRKFRGNVTARRALANSLNVPSIEVLNRLGIDKAVEMAKRLGITTIHDSSNYGLSLGLGAAEVKLVELTGAYATFANSGYKNSPTTIIQIEDKMGNVVYNHEPEMDPVLKPEAAFLISSILSDNNTRAEVFFNTLNLSRQAAVKTGTTEDYRDAWTLGYTPSLAIGVWVGNNDGVSMDQVAGSLGAAPIWRSLMERFLQTTTPEQFTPPLGIVTQTACILPGSKQTIAVVEYFIEGTQPQTSCSIIKTPTPTIIISPTVKLSPIKTLLPLIPFY
ncbi:MAG: penicillin-binding protein [Candidatus Roizmanbacteria bacterium]|nr:MAG: penicillin-binding protein [Candidatus Roizmanbacteria bacterium]